MGMNFYEMLVATWDAAAAKDSEAELYECTAPNGLDHVRSVFRGADNTTLICNAYSDGKVGHVETIDSPWMEDVVIYFSLKLTLLEATECLYEAKYSRDWKDVILRHPLGHTKWGEGYVLGDVTNNPLYIFNYHDGANIAVDTFTKEVTPL